LIIQPKITAAIFTKNLGQVKRKIDTKNRPFQEFPIFNVYRVLYFGEKFNKKNSKKLINLKILCT
jgi:hypothetical protein